MLQRSCSTQQSSGTVQVALRTHLLTGMGDCLSGKLAWLACVQVGHFATSRRPFCGGHCGRAVSHAKCGRTPLLLMFAKATAPVSMTGLAGKGDGPPLITLHIPSPTPPFGHTHIHMYSLPMLSEVGACGVQPMPQNGTSVHAFEMLAALKWWWWEAVHVQMSCLGGQRVGCATAGCDVECCHAEATHRPQ